MNSIIRFHDAERFGQALTVLELTSTPCYECDTVAHTIESDEIDTIADILNANDIPNSAFEVEEVEAERIPGEDMDGDHDSAMASAGFGTDEDYGSANEHFSGDE